MYHVVTVDHHLPDVRSLESGEYSKGRRLATARGTEESDELSGLDVEREAVESFGGAETSREVIEHDRRASLWWRGVDGRGLRDLGFHEHQLLLEW